MRPGKRPGGRAGAPPLDQPLAAARMLSVLPFGMPAAGCGVLQVCMRTVREEMVAAGRGSVAGYVARAAVEAAVRASGSAIVLPV